MRAPTALATRVTAPRTRSALNRRPATARVLPPSPAHTLLHKNNRSGRASLANLSKLPAQGAILIAAPLKIKNGTGSPIRALALVPRG